MAVFPKVDAASPRGLMAPPGLRPWAPRVLSGIGSAFRTGSPGSALGSYVISLCAYPAWDTQVSRSWPLACPIRGLPFSRLTDWGGMAPCGANINAALRRRPPLVAGATTFPPQAGAQQPVHNIEPHMILQPRGALLSHRSAGGRWCRKAPKGEKPPQAAPSRRLAFTSQ